MLETLMNVLSWQKRSLEKTCKHRYSCILKDKVEKIKQNQISPKNHKFHNKILLRNLFKNIK